MGVRRHLLSLGPSVGGDAVSRAVLDDLFRHFHSLKGISGMVEVRPAEELAHRLEDYLRLLRAGNAPLRREGLDALFDGTQTLEQVIAARRAGVALPQIDAIADRIGRVVAAGAASGTDLPQRAAADGARSNASRRWQITFTPSQDLVARGVRVDTIRQRLASAGEIVAAAPRVTPGGTIAFDFVLAGEVDESTAAAWRQDGIRGEPMVGAPAPPAMPAATDRLPIDAAGTSSPGAVAPPQVVRVALPRLDDLMRNVGDLVISRARLGETLARVEQRLAAADWRAIQDNAGAIDRQLRALRGGVMRVRRGPGRGIFRRLPVRVRGLAREAGERAPLPRP